MAAFHTGAIGLSEQSRTESWIEYDGLALHAIPPHIAAGIDISQLREDYPVKFVFEAADPEAEGARLAGAGVTAISRSWGGHDYADPEGNIFSIIAGALRLRPVGVGLMVMSIGRALVVMSIARPRMAARRAGNRLPRFRRGGNLDLLGVLAIGCGNRWDHHRARG